MKVDRWFLVLDIGGTWIKAAAVQEHALDTFNMHKDPALLSALFTGVEKSPFLFTEQSTAPEFLFGIKALFERCLRTGSAVIAGVGIATSGVVNYHGTAIEATTPALTVLQRLNIKELLEAELKCPVVLVNDNDAATIGLAALGLLGGVQTTGVLCIGTGLGCTIIKNGRRWRPDGNYTLLGSIYTSLGSYDELASASKLAALREDGDLAAVLREPDYAAAVREYWLQLAGIISSAAVLYNMDDVYIAGGLVEAAGIAGCDIRELLLEALHKTAPAVAGRLTIRVAEEGNRLQLLGAASLIAAEAKAAAKIIKPAYRTGETEKPYRPDALLNEWGAGAIVHLLNDAEKEAGEQLAQVTDQVAGIARRVADALDAGGRLIYIGAGSSGRIAAMDAVEIPCTYGLPKDRVVTLIAGGVANAAIDIEENFEEDASSIPELLMLNISAWDVVLGISASGFANYVLSGLSYASSCGAYTVMIQHDPGSKNADWCDEIVPLGSGPEVVAGSTRMKAGTATKKLLNFITTTAMILSGKVDGSYMTNLKCLNEKLVLRACSILQILFKINKTESLAVLKASDYDLGAACKKMRTCLQQS
ncbi:N-acetylmuramic acid 6-phosphate etherase [Niabella aurantiaca]|uniref:N-acetylmuramic acid 6-phosphate etherase n=1 Tax=Niabella aurantiaca TaxID=379900 RepID=UPI000364319C|nr:N-acetylmuramic acid 6-phosphate etherase [Niabella aurantiaca]